MFRIAPHLRTLVALFAALALSAAAPAAATAQQHHRHHARHHAPTCHIRQGAGGTDNDSDNHGGPSDGDGCI